MKNLLILLFFFTFFVLNGQYAEPKFGKIDISELELNKYDKDTSANALMLFDNGISTFEIGPDQTFQFVFTRHCRIKIFKKSAFSLADVSIRLYNTTSKSAKEKLSGLKAVTYNLVDGKIVKTKLDDDKIYEAVSKNYVDQKFAFPEVKEGSIIELSYTIKSDFLYDFRGWKFQYSYPALWSQYKCVIPEYYDYRKSTKGYLQFDINKNERGNESYTIHSEYGLSPGEGARTSTQSSNINATTKNILLAVKDVPAFISEPNIDCEDNYIQSIEFELSSVQFPNQLREDYTASWESVNKQMIDDEDFGKLLKSDGFILDTVSDLCADKTSETEKALAIYKYVQTRMKWNGNYSLWSPTGLKKPFNNRIGNSAEINMLLTLMLKSAGIKADPVMLSTRDNGFANTFFPTVSKFNSVITKAEIGGKTILLDATSKFCPFGVLPANDLNEKGRVVNNSNGDWVDLATITNYKENISYNLEIDPEGKFTGSITEILDGYAGIYFRNTLANEKSNDDFIRKLQENQNGLTINSYTISNLQDYYKPTGDSLVVEITDNAEISGDKILFNPLLFESTEKNRYTLEDRQYPVNYNFPFSETYSFEYTLPDGFQVESMPESASFKLPDNSISVNYTLQSSGNKIKILYTRNVNKILFLPEEYKNLKALYDQMVKKHAEQIILKKV